MREIRWAFLSPLYLYGRDKVSFPISLTYLWAMKFLYLISQTVRKGKLSMSHLCKWDKVNFFPSHFKLYVDVFYKNYTTTIRSQLDLIGGRLIRNTLSPNFWERYFLFSYLYEEISLNDNTNSDLAGYNLLQRLLPVTSADYF